MGYITAFTRLGMKGSNLSKAENWDRFLRGQKLAVFERAILLEPSNFAEAARLASHKLRAAVGS